MSFTAIAAFSLAQIGTNTGRAAYLLVSPGEPEDSIVYAQAAIGDVARARAQRVFFLSLLGANHPLTMKFPRAAAQSSILTPPYNLAPGMA